MKDEIWLRVRDYEGYYEVSSRGRVRSVARTIIRSDGQPRNYPGMILAQKFQSHYMRVELCKNSTQRSWCVHRLVAESFHGKKPDGDTVVRHLNGDPLDNRMDNLAWGTRAENSADMRLHGTNYQANKTRCKRGHLFTDANTRIYRGRRVCRACERMHDSIKRKNRKSR